MRTRSPLRFALIGCGSFGKQLGRYLLEVGKIGAVCDVDAARAKRTAEELGLDVPIDTDFRQTVGRDNLDAVAITAANFAHGEITLAAAQAGLHVFCEKAMARTTDECWRMVRACEKHNVKLMIGHKRRLRPSWARMIELTDEALLGAPLAITVTQYADMRPYGYPGTWWADPKKSGGAFAILGVHVIDWFGAMCGRATRVHAVNGLQLDAGYHFPDIAHVIYQFADGALASLNTSFSFPLHKFREAQGPLVQCRHGGLKLVPQMDHLDLYWQRLDEEKPHHERFEIRDDFDPAYRREIGDFVRWISEDRQPCLTWREGLRCVESMEAAYRSAEKGVPIDLPLYPKLES
jgi:predicted dehydrogenase